MSALQRFLHVLVGVVLGVPLGLHLSGDYAADAARVESRPVESPAPADTGNRDAREERRRWEREREELARERDEAEARVRAVTQARAEGKDVVAAENEKLKDEVRRLREFQRAVNEREREQSGRAIPMPESLPESYRQEGLRTAFLDILREAGFHGDVKSIDCTEFPCVVYGDGNIAGGKADGEAQVHALDEALRKKFPGEQHSVHQSVWTTGKRDESGAEQQRVQFGISVYPKGTVDDATRDEARRRLRWRQREYMESLGE